VQALAISMQACATPAPAESRPAATDLSPGTLAAVQASEAMDDEELKLAMSMSVEASQGATSGAPAGEAGMAGLYDPGFLSSVLSSLPGVDTSDPRVQGVLDGIKKDEKQDGEKKDEKK
jgi:26S proteasome regulatory subunit N10